MYSLQDKTERRIIQKAENMNYRDILKKVGDESNLKKPGDDVGKIHKTWNTVNGEATATYKEKIEGVSEIKVQLKTKDMDEIATTNDIRA